MENTIEFDEYRKCMEDIVYFTKYCYLNTVERYKTICIDMTRPMRNTMDPPMNAIQMRVAKSICDEYGITLHNAINDKMWW